jgi:hypothetical protein
MFQQHPSAEILHEPRFETIGPDGVRVKRAFHKHGKNIKEWEKTIQTFQQLRYERCVFDRICGNQQKMYSARMNKSHKSPSALRTLIELQRYYESPSVNKEESFVIQEKQTNFVKTFENFHDQNGENSIQNIASETHPIAFRNMKEDVFNASRSNLGVTLPELNIVLTSENNSPSRTKYSGKPHHLAASTFHESQSALRLRSNKT